MAFECRLDPLPDPLPEPVEPDLGADPGQPPGHRHPAGRRGLGRVHEPGQVQWPRRGSPPLRGAGDRLRRPQGPGPGDARLVRSSWCPRMSSPACWSRRPASPPPRPARPRATPRRSPSPAAMTGPSGPNLTYECKLDPPGPDEGTWGSCATPQTYTGLEPGHLQLPGARDRPGRHGRQHAGRHDLDDRGSRRSTSPHPRPRSTRVRTGQRCRRAPRSPSRATTRTRRSSASWTTSPRGPSAARRIS